MAVNTETGNPFLNTYFSKNGGGFSVQHDWQDHPRLDTNSVGDWVSFKTVNS